jgi:hypothetical protein
VWPAACIAPFPQMKGYFELCGMPPTTAGKTKTSPPGGAAQHLLAQDTDAWRIDRVTTAALLTANGGYKAGGRCSDCAPRTIGYTRAGKDHGFEDVRE